MASLFGALVLCPMVSALAFNAPQATPMADAVGLDAGIGMPQPTEAPNVQELHRRQDSNSLYLIEGPDEVCGYQYGQSSGALRLCYTSTCGFATAPGGLGPNLGEIFCYDATTSSPRPTWTSCIPGGTAGSSCLADSACSNNRGIIVCTVTSEPYCNVGTFVGLGVEAVWCDSTYYTNMIPISTTYLGQFDRSLTTVLNPAVSSSAYTPPSPTTPSIIVSPQPPVSVSSTPATPTNSPSPQHSTAIGPIVGGVIGGLALIAAIAAGIFICLRIKRKDAQRTQQAPGPDYPVQTSTQPTSPSGQNEKYPATTQATFVPAAAAFPASKPDQQYQYQQQYQPPPQQYQQHPQPQYQQAPPAQQQSPQSTGNYTQYQPPPQESAQKPAQAQYYPQQDFQTQAEAPGTHRDSISNTSISSPGSPAPPYPSNFPPVPEMGETHNAYPQYPVNQRSEMP